MNSAELISDAKLLEAASYAFNDGCHRTADELRLMLLELVCKVSAGFGVSHTEGIFLGNFKLLKRDRTANKAGRMFICRMISSSSNRHPECYELIRQHRHPF